MTIQNLKSSKLVKIVGAGVVGSAVILGGAYYGIKAYTKPIGFTEQESKELEAVIKAPKMIADKTSEAFLEGLNEFGEDYKKNPEKYKDLFQQKQ